MSGLAGILRSDGAPVAAAALEAMTAPMAHRGPDGGDRWTRGQVGLAHLLLRTVPDDVAGRQPLRSADGRLCLTLDGHVDNRAELRAQLGADRELLRDGSDAALVLQGFLRWGTGVLARIVGDFALALWDGRREELLLARDVLGRRPLYYHRDARGLRWASEPQAVLADPAIERAPNLGMIAEFLAGTPRDREATLIEGLQRLPPAHLLRAGPGGVRTERYWDWDPERTVRHTSDAAYVEDFLERFTQAVACRAGGPHPVGAELSGGVDSSAVVAVATEVLGTGDALRLFSLVFPGHDCDESPYIRAVAAHCGLPVDEHDPQPQGTEFYVTQTARQLVLPEPPNLAMHRATTAAARAAGCRVMLTGQGGDEWFTGSPYAYADRLRTLRPAGWRAARAGARADRAQWPARSGLHQLVRDGLAPLLPPAAQTAVGRFASRELLPPWLSEDLRRRTGLEERLRVPLPRGPRLASAHVAQSLRDGWAVHVAETAERAYAEQGLEARGPFEDRRLIEFALGVPDDVRRRAGATKWVVRAAMDGRLPDSVRLRAGKASFREVFFREFLAQGGRSLFTNLVIEERGWVDGERLRAAYDHAEAQYFRGSGAPWIWALWCALSTERWVHATMRGMSASI